MLQDCPGCRLLNDELAQAVAERDKMRAALEKIATEFCDEECAQQPALCVGCAAREALKLAPLASEEGK